MRDFSPLAGDRRLALGFYRPGDGRVLRRYMARLEDVEGMIFHHIVGNITSLQRELLNTRRTLSVNYGVGGGRVWGCVSERYKANTTSHYADHSHITVETANELLAPTYKIGDADFDMAARLAADCAHEYGFVPSSKTIRFHREFYATACPGPDFWGRRDEFIALCRKYYDGAVVEPAKPAPSKPAPKPAPEKASSGLPAAGVAMLNGVGIGDVLRIRNWAMYSDPGFTTGERLVSGDYKIVSITYKYRGGIEPSLEVEDSRGGRGWVSYNAVAGVIGKGGGAPSKPKPARKSNETIADEVLAGKWGNGAERQRRLEAAGYSYAAVQAAVNAKLGGSKPKAKSIADMAREVIAGKHGNGHASRQRSLGVSSATYAKVRAEVNRRI